MPNHEIEFPLDGLPFFSATLRELFKLDLRKLINKVHINSKMVEWWKHDGENVCDAKKWYLLIIFIKIYAKNYFENVFLQSDGNN